MKIRRNPTDPIIWPGKWEWRRVAVFSPGVTLTDDGTSCLYERACGSLRPFQCGIGLLAGREAPILSMSRIRPC